jgi:phage terminase large subunit-like protein
MTEGSGARENPQLVAITTAGGNKDTLLGKLYDYGVKVSKGEIKDDSFGFFWWGADDSDDPTDIKTWMKANPNLASGKMDIKDFESAIARANATSFNSFKRFRLNMWVRVGSENFIAPHYWENAKRNEDIQLGEDIFIGFDGSINNDATAIVAINKAGTLKVLGIWEPHKQDDDYIIPREEVKSVIEKAFKDYNVIKLWADPTHYEDMLKELSNVYRNKVERIPQSNSRIIPMAQQFITDIIYKNIGHTSHEILTTHVLNAVATEAGSYKKEKPKSPNKIDLLAAAVMANGARNKMLGKNTTTWKGRIL